MNPVFSEEETNQWHLVMQVSDQHELSRMSLSEPRQLLNNSEHQLNVHK